MLEAALKQSGLSQEEQTALRAQARAKGLGIGLGLIGAAVAAAQAERQARQAARSDRAAERADYAASGEAELDSAARSYMAWAKAVEEGRFDTQAYAKAAEHVHKPAEPAKSWWRRAGEWVEEKVGKFVKQPPSWLSVSYSMRLFDPMNLFMDEIVYPQFSARNGFETFVYQKTSVSLEMTSKVTSNPSGWIDINFSNGRITFKGNPRPDGSRVEYFIQPFALNAGQIVSTPKPGDPKVRTLNVSTIDIDVVGRDWASLKVSQATGESKTDIEILPTGETIAISGDYQLQATVNIHRWPRIVVIAGAILFVWEAVGGAAAVQALASSPVLQQLIQAIHP